MAKVELPNGVSKKDAENFLSSLQPLQKGSPILFKEIEVSYNSLIRIHKTYYKGKELLSIQKFWRADETQDWQFGKAITFPDEAIDDIIEGFTKMKAYLEGGEEE